MYEIGRKPKKSEAFARVICHIAVKEKGLSIEVSLSESGIEGIADLPLTATRTRLLIF